MYTGHDDPNLPDDIKQLTEIERKIYVMFFNPLLQKFGSGTGDAFARDILLRWQNRDLSVRGI